MKRLIITLILLTASQIGLAMNNPSILPAGSNLNEEHDDQPAEHIDKKLKQRRTYKCPHPDCINKQPFSCSSGLRQHELSHKATPEEQRPYQCRIEGCTERFTQLGHRNNHENAHDNKKQYACTFNDCTKTFARDNDRQNHEDLHHRGIKKNVCSVCGLVIARAGNLKTHERTHTGERPYRCDICDKGFPRADALKTHKSACMKTIAELLLTLKNDPAPQNRIIEHDDDDADEDQADLDADPAKNETLKNPHNDHQ